MDEAAAVLLGALEARGDAPFVRTDGHTTTGAALAAAVRLMHDDPTSLPEALRSNDLAPGDVVAMRGEHVLLDVALPLLVWSRGQCVQFVGARETRSSVDGLLSQSGARFLYLCEAPGAFGGVPLGGARRAQLGAGTLLATSGSGGKPKLVYHPLERHFESAHAQSVFLDLGPQDRLLASLPMWHVGGLSMLFRALLSDASLCVPPAGMGLREALARFEPTQVSLVATQLKRLLDDEDAVARLRACRTVLLGGGPAPVALRARALDLGIPLAVTYGATETCAFVAASRDPDVVVREDAAGEALSGCEIDVDGSGRIGVHSDTLFDGYLTAEGLAPATDANGRWTTGDLGRLEDGILYVSGRADRMFISGGENVQPEDVEEALLALEGVAEAVVVPVPHEDFGERPVAFVDGADLDASVLDAALRELLPGFKAPDTYYRMPERPDGRLKPDLRMLAAMARDPLAASRLERL